MIPPSPKLVRGTIVIVDFSADAQGREQMKIRPAIVISSDFYNERLDTVIVVPLSSLKDGAVVRTHEVLVKQGEGGLAADSVAQPIQVRTIDRTKRCQKVIGKVSPLIMRDIIAKLGEAVGATAGP
jgi:mRNA interferase MazF